MIAAAAGVIVGAAVIMGRRGAGAGAADTLEPAPAAPVPGTSGAGWPLYTDGGGMGGGGAGGWTDPLDPSVDGGLPPQIIVDVPPVDLSPIAEALRPVLDPGAGSPTPAVTPPPSRVTEPKHTAPGDGRIIWRGKAKPNVANLAKAFGVSPGQITVKRRGGNEGYVAVLAPGATPSRPIPEPRPAAPRPAASAPTAPAAPRPAAPAPAAPRPPAPARPAPGTIIWSGKNPPNLATLRAAHPGVALDVKRRGGNLGYVVVVV